jgi:CRP-like cAMP-binding protein/GNAT superfamily N-acetyltransferase
MWNDAQQFQPFELLSEDGSVRVRDATDADVDQIRQIFQACYGEDYPYPSYYDSQLLKKMVFADDTIILVAEDVASGRVLGTGSVLLDVGAFADLVGEFGRLAVHPDARRRGIGRLLMTARIDRVQDRLHVGLVDNRAAHTFSQRISLTHQFVPVGFLPNKLRIAKRESVVLFARHFGDALALRKNNPRIIPEAYPLAEWALPGCGLNCDAIVDEQAAAYPQEDRFQLDQLTTHGYTTLMRFERGRVQNREIFGPVQLHCGLFQLRATHTNYLIAREHGKIVGAVGFTLDSVERAIRIIELVSLDDRPIHFLLDRLVHTYVAQGNVEFMEVDVSAYSPRMQRTLLALGFLPAAYVPAQVFQLVERLDAIRMVRLLVPLDERRPDVVDRARPIADWVIRSCTAKVVEPRVAEAADKIGLFHGLSAEQSQQLASICTLQHFARGSRILVENQRDDRTYLILEGTARVAVGPAPQQVGSVGSGECLGEMSLLRDVPHGATVHAETDVEVAELRQEQLNALIRQRPDIGLILYRNLATGIGEKLSRADRTALARS